jgi:hypothetical protein
MGNKSLIGIAFGLVLASVGTLSAETDWKGMAKQAMDQIAQNPQAAQLADGEIVQGLREALAKGTRSAVLQLGKADGFWASDRFRIPLPKTVTKADTLLRAGGYGPQIDELHLSFNRAAEQSVPVAADVFAQAVQKLTITDARNILSGAPDAATQYFKKTTGETLALKFKPLVAQVTARAGLVTCVLAGFQRTIRRRRLRHAQGARPAVPACRRRGESHPQRSGGAHQRGPQEGVRRQQVSK